MISSEPLQFVTAVSLLDLWGMRDVKMELIRSVLVAERLTGRWVSHVQFQDGNFELTFAGQKVQDWRSEAEYRELSDFLQIPCSI